MYLDPLVVNKNQMTTCSKLCSETAKPHNQVFWHRDVIDTYLQCSSIQQPCPDYGFVVPLDVQARLGFDQQNRI